MAKNKNSARSRMVDVVSVVTALALATSTGMRLHSYAVPLGLLITCVLAVASSALWLLSKVAEAAESTVHRCTAEGCTFQVRVRHGSAADSRRWQEIAAAHPTHHNV
ncbi:hypothetical protein ACIRL3_40570 [Streptomyces sp. NPDC102384]|uniref:hypothetical protein n=1 Tax=Streptomyces sp. NPDC102384 TaxID=3366166 RepID=UPI0037F85C32